MTLGVWALAMVWLQHQPATAQETPVAVSSMAALYQEPFRPQYHFTPATNWNNDPNGLVYYAGEYHLFYQYFPGGMRWGPMHWGHAVSRDLLHWDSLGIALYPDTLGYIFSGSAVVDESNTSGFQEGSEKPLVAMFTYHEPRSGLESQAIAYSTDKGRTWTKYAGNPVIPNPGFRDFRDPKVRWFPPLKTWIMVVAAGDRVVFYSSPNLRQWTKESEFGQGKGSHGGVWECPDLFPLTEEGTSTPHWILTVNNGGSPAGGGGTQYFMGQFDGHVFKAGDDSTRWLNAGADEYAGCTWSNTGDRTIFMGWLNNWPEAHPGRPAYRWRGGMTLPLELRLRKGDAGLYVSRLPVTELTGLQEEIFRVARQRLLNSLWMQSFDASAFSSSRSSLTLKLHKSPHVRILLKNRLGQHVDILYDREKRTLSVDRSEADRDDFHASSRRRHEISIPVDLSTLDLDIYYDRSTLEIFVDGGRWSLTDLVFPDQPYESLQIEAGGNTAVLAKLQVFTLKSIWH